MSTDLSPRMEYSRWTDCPPRAPIGQISAIYGSFDHLLLLLGRVTDFAVRDRSRKVKASASRSGEAARRARKTPQAPTFFGISSAGASAPMPSAYQPSTPLGEFNVANEGDITDLNATTKQALDDWTSIKTALNTYASMLGENFQPLSDEYNQPLSTPFGKALFYRTSEIGCLWAIYNMTLIIAHRSHPHMPPQVDDATINAGVETRQYSYDIARIAAGMVLPSYNQTMNPIQGAAFCEICLPLYFAAVQFQNAMQREWLISRLEETEKRYGYAMAATISQGCQAAWQKAYKSGKGHPYMMRPGKSRDSSQMSSGHGSET